LSRGKNKKVASFLKRRNHPILPRHPPPQNRSIILSNELQWSKSQSAHTVRHTPTEHMGGYHEQWEQYEGDSRCQGTGAVGEMAGGFGGYVCTIWHTSLKHITKMLSYVFFYTRSIENVASIEHLFNLSGHVH